MKRRGEYWTVRQAERSVETAVEREAEELEKGFADALVKAETYKVPGRG